MTAFEEFFKNLKKRSQLPKYNAISYSNSNQNISNYISSNYSNSDQDIIQYNSSIYVNATSINNNYESSNYINSIDNRESYNSENYINANDNKVASNATAYINSTSNSLSGTSKIYINQLDTSESANATFAYISSSSKDKSLGLVTDISDVYDLLQNNKIDDTNYNSNSIEQTLFNVNLINFTTTTKDTFYNTKAIYENSVIKLPEQSYLGDFKKTYTLNGITHIFFPNYNLSENKPKHTFNSDDESGIFANTAFNPKDDNGKVSKTEKEKSYKVHLRNYWKALGKGTSNGGDIYGGLVGTQISVDNGYRQRLVDRMKGYVPNASESDKITKENFIAGIGVGAEEYQNLMRVDDLMTISGSGIPKSVLTDPLAIERYGTLAKRDIIIDTGRFKKTKLDNPVSDGWTPGLDKYEFNLMTSFFATSPMRTPYYRNQVLALGTEVTNLNAFVDLNRITKINYNIAFINDDNTYAIAKESKHASFGITTPISVLNKRAPDFMSNMYNVFITYNDSIDNNLYEIYAQASGVNSATANSDLKRETKINYDDYLSQFFRKDSFFYKVIATRCTGIQVKMPELKSNSLNYIGRKVAYIESNLNWTHEGTFSIRLDEELDIYKGFLSMGGVDYQNKDAATNMDARELINRLNSIKPTSRLKSNKNESDNNTNKPIRMDLHVRYGFVNASIPLKNLNIKSTPFGETGPIDYASDGAEPYYREYVFTNIKFYGMDEIELSKDGETTEVSVPFIFADIYEVVSGHSYAES